MVLGDGDPLSDFDVHRGDVLVETGDEFGELGDLDHEGGFFLFGCDRLYALGNLESIQEDECTM